MNWRIFNKFNEQETNGSDKLKNIYLRKEYKRREKERLFQKENQDQTADQHT